MRASEKQPNVDPTFATGNKAFVVMATRGINCNPFRAVTLAFQSDKLGGGVCGRSIVQVEFNYKQILQRMGFTPAFHPFYPLDIRNGHVAGLESARTPGDSSQKLTGSPIPWPDWLAK